MHVRISNFGNRLLAAQSPHIWIAGLITAGGMGLIHSSVYASTEKGYFQRIIESSRRRYERLDISQNDHLFAVQERSSPVIEPLSSNVQVPASLQLQADRQIYDERKDRFIADGSASAVLNGAVLKADRIEFDRAFQTLYATGRVRLRKGRQYFQASSFRYNITKRKGYFKDVYGVLDLEYLGKDLKLISPGYLGNLFQSPSSSSDLSKPNIPTLKSSNSPPEGVSKSIWHEAVVNPLNASPPIEAWSNDHKTLEGKKAVETDEFSCPPKLPSIPDWHPHPWAITAWGGQMTDSEFGEAFFFNGTSRPEYLLGFGISKRIYRSGPVSLELEADWFGHIADKQAGGKYNQSVAYADTAAQSFGEGVLGIGARLWLRPWLNLGFVEGISYTTSFSNYERTKRDKYSKLLNYLGFEIEVLLSESLSVVGRLHHRSGAFGTFAGAKEGSNAYLVGFRYRWGQDNSKQTTDNEYPTPSECLSKGQAIRRTPSQRDDRIEIYDLDFLDTNSSNKLPSALEIKASFTPKENLVKTAKSDLSLRQQELIREQAIAQLDQAIYRIEYRDSLKIKAQIGIPKSAKNSEQRNKFGGGPTSRLSQLSRAKFITGSITRWRFQSPRLVINEKGWNADRMSFTNDPFTPTQTRIESKGVIAVEEDNGDILISTRRSRLIVEERMSLPILKSRRIRQTEEVENRWVFGIDVKDRDGLFIGRVFKPIQIGSQYQLSLQPQFNIQRAVKGETNSYISSGSSLTSGRVVNDVDASDLFGMKAKLRGRSFDWDVKLNANISTFNPERIANGSRYWAGLNRTFNTDTFGELDSSFFGAYRYKAWNGSLGETDIYLGYGGYLEKSKSWKWGLIDNNYIVRLGVAKYKAESLAGDKLIGLWRSNIYSSLSSEYVIWEGKVAALKSSAAYKYSPIPIHPKLAFNTNLSASYFLYQDGANQSTLTLRGGPELTLGTFSKPFFDYTKVSLSAGGTLKQGSSPFAFDNAVDLATIGLALTQQLAGPLVFNTGFDFNIDQGSKYFGKTINSKFELRWQRRSYDIGLFYSPETGVGGLSFRLNDFNFDGNGIPFVPAKSSL